MEISEDDLFVAALIFERANGNQLHDDEALLIESSQLSSCSAESIESALVEVLTAAQQPSYRNAAYWALGKRFNTKLIPAFKQWIKQELQNNDPGAIYQLLIALDNLGEPVFGKDREGCYSVIDSELNVRDAKSYLEKYAG